MGKSFEIVEFQTFGEILSRHPTELVLFLILIFVEVLFEISGLASACCHLYNSRARSIQELVLLKCLYIKSLRYFLYQLQKVVILLASISLVSKFQAFHLFKFKIKRRFFNFKEPITNLKEVKQSRQRNKADSFLMRIICPIVKCTWQKKNWLLTCWWSFCIVKLKLNSFFNVVAKKKRLGIIVNDEELYVGFPVYVKT